MRHADMMRSTCLLWANSAHMRHIRLCVCKHERPPPSPETKYLLWLVQMQARVREHHVCAADSDAVFFVCGAGPEEHLCHQGLAPPPN